ncbi:MAG TPA: flagellar protein FlaG [Firmicutes bacterium]|nr:flagellar protein FlaG [Bacillota bacterium]HHY98911.1 flagellar protein FlaG [Bacillota bacterium]
MDDFRVHGTKPIGALTDNTPNILKRDGALQPGGGAEQIQGSQGHRRGDDEGGKSIRVSEVNEKMNAVMQMLNTRVTFEVDRKTGEVIIRLIDSSTGTIVREIPPHELRAIAMTLAELAEMAGMVVDKKG